MTIALPPTANRPTVATERRRRFVGSMLGLSVLIGVFLVLMALMFIYQPPMGLSLLVLLLLLAAVVGNPAFALGAVIVLAVVGDPVSMRWWPVTKNLSARESIFFVADALRVKPIDLVMLALIIAVLLNRRLASNPPPLKFGELARPMLVFTVTIFTGLAWGLSQGGSIRVAYFELTPLLYIPVGYFLACNLFTKLSHYRKLAVGIFVALTIETVHAIWKIEEIKTRVGEDQSAFEHTAAIHFNLAILLLIAIGWFGANRAWPRFPFIVMVIPMALLLIDGERRAGIVALIIGGFVLSVALFVRDHQKYLRTIPVVLIIALGYTAAFWGATDSQLGFPAQAVRSVVQPDAASDSDARSDLYRDLENLNLHATIRSNPLLGVGFGKPFLQPYPLFDISGNFEFADYIPHNTLLWYWLKTGVFGFVSFIYLSLLALARGLKAVVGLRDPVDAAVMVSFVSYIPMALVVAYVDISLDPVTIILLGLSLAAATSAEWLDDSHPAGPRPSLGRAPVVPNGSTPSTNGSAPSTNGSAPVPVPGG